tara:strand:+ start:8954 stop:9091 length:138 start_codon:yes stop_codon:yes gene_type:complete
MIQISKKDLAKLGITAGLVMLVVFSYYATGIYLNIQKIKKVKDDK